MSDYQIITDSSCDFTAQKYRELGLLYAPLTLLYKGSSCGSFTEEADLKAFYNSLREGEMPSTAAVNPEGWAKVMTPCLEAGKDILCLAFSSGLSTTYQSAVIAAKDLQEQYPQRRIRVVDTLAASLGQGLLVWYACRKRDEGLTLEELTAWCEENKLHLRHEFTVGDLEQLKRGGRVSAATALLGGMLNIKPMLCVDEAGKLITIGKVRGRKASIDSLVQQVAAHDEGWDNSTMFICHGDCREDAEYLAQQVKDKYGVKEVYIGYTGAVIGAHTGPGVLALFFMGTKR